MLPFLAWHGILLTVSGQFRSTLSARIQGQTIIAMVGKSGKRTRLTLQEKFGGVGNVGKRQFASAVMYKFWRFDVENDDACAMQ